MSSRKTLLFSFLYGGVFLFIDQWLKWQSLHVWNEPILAFGNVGWYPFLNTGVAFSIPLPTWLVLLFTIPLVVSMVWYVFRLARAEQSKQGSRQIAALTLIVCGALSNIVDRLLYKVTVDFFLILHGVINIGDILIVLGFILLFFSMGKDRHA